MRLKFMYSMAILTAVIILASCNGIDSKLANTKKPATTVPGAATTNPDEARRVTIDELEAMIKDGSVYIVDVRNQAAYDLGHIPGAVLIPAGDIVKHIGELPKDKTIVTYCS